jgi:hypothetical protein
MGFVTVSKFMIAQLAYIITSFKQIPIIVQVSQLSNLCSTPALNRISNLMA